MEPLGLNFGPQKRLLDSTWRLLGAPRAQPGPTCLPQSHFSTSLTTQVPSKCFREPFRDPDLIEKNPSGPQTAVERACAAQCPGPCLVLLTCYIPLPHQASLTCRISQRRRKTIPPSPENRRKTKSTPMPQPCRGLHLLSGVLLHCIACTLPGFPDLPHSTKSSNQIFTASPKDRGKSVYCTMPQLLPGPTALPCPKACQASLTCKVLPLARFP